MAKMTKTQLTNMKRDEVMNLFMDFLTERGEDVMRVSGNAFGFPALDSEGNELVVKVTIAIPRGERNGEAYDIYTEAQQYIEHCEDVAANKARREKEKQEAAKKRAVKIAASKAKKAEEEAARAKRRAERENEGE